MQSRQKNNLIWTNSIPRFLIRNRSPIHEDKSGLNKSIHEVNNLVKAEGQSNKPECSGQLCMYLMARTVICACCVFTWMRHAVFAFGVFKSLHVWQQHYCDFTVLPVKSFSVKFFPTKLGKLFLLQSWLCVQRHCHVETGKGAFPKHSKHTIVSNIIVCRGNK